jgi:hypothetical protein
MLHDSCFQTAADSIVGPGRWNTFEIQPLKP